MGVSLLVPASPVVGGSFERDGRRSAVVVGVLVAVGVRGLCERMVYAALAKIRLMTPSNWLIES